MPPGRRIRACRREHKACNVTDYPSTCAAQYDEDKSGFLEMEEFDRLLLDAGGESWVNRFHFRGLFDRFGVRVAALPSAQRVCAW